MVYNKRVVLLEKCHKGEITKENWFVDLFYDMEIKIDKQKFPNSIFFFKKDECLFIQDYKNDVFWINNTKVWLVFKIKFNLKDSEISSLIKFVVDKHLKISVSTLEIFYILPSTVEEHFKMKI